MPNNIINSCKDLLKSKEVQQQILNFMKLDVKYIWFGQ